MEIMSRGLQIFMICIALIAMIAVSYGAIRTKLNVRFAVFWIFWCIVILMIGIFPEIARWCAKLIGIQTVSNLVFMAMIGVLFFLSYYTFIRMSKMGEEIKRLTYEVSVLKNEQKKTEECK